MHIEDISVDSLIQPQATHDHRHPPFHTRRLLLHHPWYPAITVLRWGLKPSYSNRTLTYQPPRRNGCHVPWRYRECHLVGRIWKIAFDLYWRPRPWIGFVLGWWCSIIGLRGRAATALIGWSRLLSALRLLWTSWIFQSCVKISLKIRMYT